MSPPDILSGIEAYLEPPGSDLPASSNPTRPASADDCQVKPVTTTADPSDSDELLMAKFYQGDDGAFEILYKRRKIGFRARVDQEL